MEVKSFMWLQIRDRLSLRDHLARLHMISAQDKNCSFRGVHVEDFSHIFTHWPKLAHFGIDDEENKMAQGMNMYGPRSISPKVA